MIRTQNLARPRRIQRVFPPLRLRSKPANGNGPAARLKPRQPVLPVAVNAKQESIARLGAPDLGTHRSILIPQLEYATRVLFRTKIDGQAQSPCLFGIAMPIDMLIGSGHGAVQPAGEITDLRTTSHFPGDFEQPGSVQDEMEKKPGPLRTRHEQSSSEYLSVPDFVLFHELRLVQPVQKMPQNGWGEEIGEASTAGFFEFLSQTGDVGGITQYRCLGKLDHMKVLQAGISPAPDSVYIYKAAWHGNCRFRYPR